MSHTARNLQYNEKNGLFHGSKDLRGKPLAVPTRMGREIEKQFWEAINDLQKIKKIRGQCDIDAVLNILDKLLVVFPGPLTLQQILRIDVSFSYRMDLYSIIIDDLIEKFGGFLLDDKQIYDQVIMVFVTEHPEFFRVSFMNLMTALDTINRKGGKSLQVILASLLQGEGFFSAILNYIIEEDGLDEEEVIFQEYEWKKMLNVLVSVPSVVAKSFEVPVDFFLPKNFIGSLYFNIVKIIDFLSNLNELKVSYRRFGSIIEKILVSYDDKTQENVTNIFVEILANFVMKIGDKTKKYRRIIWNLLRESEKTAVDVFGKTLLMKIDPEKYNIKWIFGDYIFKNTHWKLFFFTEIPLRRIIEDTGFLFEVDEFWLKNNEFLFKNVVVYLSVFSRYHFLELLDNLIPVWSWLSIKITYVFRKEWIYTTKFTLTALSFLKNFHLENHELDKVLENVCLGLPAHLKFDVASLRNTGMNKVEIILYTCEKINENFKYKYPNKKISENLEKLVYLDMTKYYKEIQVKEDVYDLVKKLILEEQPKGCSYILPKRLFRKGMIEENRENEIIAPTLKNNYNHVDVIDQNDELDSDDDLEPNDTSNDVKVTKKEPPIYLKDLRDGLLEVKDAEIFNFSLENCWKIVWQQLPDEDPSVGLKLLEILVTLKPKFYNENFGKLVFRNCVAITCVYPVIYAEYLIREFHAEIGKYAKYQRVLMLNIFCETARNLSGWDKEEKKDEKEEQRAALKKESRVDLARRIIQERLETRTKYYSKFKLRKYDNVDIFSSCGAEFFFPQVNCSAMEQFWPRALKEGYILQINFVRMFCCYLCAAKNSPNLPQVAKEALILSWCLRDSPKPKVRMMAITLMAVFVITMPDSLLLQKFKEELYKIRLWCTFKLSSNLVKREPNSECRTLAATTVCLIDDVWKDFEREEYMYIYYLYEKPGKYDNITDVPFL